MLTLWWSGHSWWPAALRPALLYAGLGGTLAGAIRLRLDGAGWRRLGAEALAGLLTVAAVAGAVGLADLVLDALVTRAASTRSSGDPIGAAVEASIQSVLLAGFAGTLSALLYVPARGIRLAWPAWGRLRRRHVLWSLTHVQLMVTLCIAAGLAAAFTMVDYHNRTSSGVSFPSLGMGDAGDALGQVIDRLVVIAGTLLVTSTFLIAVIVVPATLISVVVLRRATRRLEHLTTATAALRAGDLSARVPVSGEDEVARLQGDFNAMAADLEGAMGALRAERDTVARLLQARRELVASVSHELRTPVATLRAYLDSALDGQPSGAPSGRVHRRRARWRAPAGPAPRPGGDGPRDGAPAAPDRGPLRPLPGRGGAPAADPGGGRDRPPAATLRRRGGPPGLGAGAGGGARRASAPAPEGPG